MLAERLKDEESIVREIGDKAESIVWKRFWFYTILVGALAGSLGLFGYKSVKDIANGANARLQPIIDDAEKRVKRAQSEIKVVSDEVSTTKGKIDTLSSEVDKQQNRVDSETGDTGKKLAALQQSVEKASQMVNDYTKKIDALQHRMEPKYEDLTRLQNSEAIAMALPNLDAPLYLSVGNARFDKRQKKPGEIWANVNVGYFGIAAHVISGDRLQQLMTKLKAAGITPIVGTPMINGSAGYGRERMDFGERHESVVLYQDPSKKELAEKVLRIASEFVNFPKPGTQLVTLPQPSTSSDAGMVAMMWDKGAFDVQIFISAP